MKSPVFSANSDCYQVTKIVYAGPIGEISEEKRRNGSTHYFKLSTSVGSTLCCYGDLESAKKAREALDYILSEAKPTLFRSGGHVIDVKSIVSFSRVLPFKKSEGNKTHGFIVNLEVANEQNSQVWLAYTSEDSAEKGRKALFAAIYAANGMSRNAQPAPEPQAVAA